MGNENLTDNGTRERIKQIAYFNWEARGKPSNDRQGQDADWKAAEEFVVKGNPSLLRCNPTQNLPAQRISKKQKATQRA